MSHARAEGVWCALVITIRDGWELSAFFPIKKVELTRVAAAAPTNDMCVRAH